MSLAWYSVGGQYGLSWGYAVIDAALAGFFWRLSRRRLFPAVLFYLHAFLVSYHLYVSIIGSTRWWVSAFINRIFEIALLYVIVCSIWRIAALAGKKLGERERGTGTPGSFFPRGVLARALG